MLSTQTRNIEILKASLDRQMPEDIAKTYNMSTASINMCTTEALRMLNRYGADLPVTADKQVLGERKDEILKAIKSTKLPKTTIMLSVHHYLKERFGDKDARKAKDVAAAWDDEVDRKFSTCNQNRERNSIMRWLASEGYYVGDYLNEHYTKVLFESIGKYLEDFKSQDDVSIDLENAQIGVDRKCLLVDFVIADEPKGMRAERRLKIEVL